MSRFVTFFFASPRLRSAVALSGLLLWLSPLLGWGQTTIVNYDFNNATSYTTATAATASGVSSVVTSSEAFNSAAGTITGNNSFTSNAAGNALGMNSYSGINARYFQFALAGAALPKYSAFKVYFQGYRSAAATVTLTLQYSLDGANYTNFGAVYTPGAGNFTEAGYDLSGVPMLNALNSLSFRLLTSTNTSGTLRVDNFQVQAVNTVDPAIGSITPSTLSAGDPDQVIALTGSNFMSGSVVSFNGQNLSTFYNSATSLTATIPAALLAAPGSFPVVVTNPVAGGSTSSAAVTFVVTAAVPRWVGRLGSSWFEPTNWSTGVVPAATDDVLLDHSFVAASYTVSFDQNTAVSIKSLTVNPGSGDSIFVVVPATNTVVTALTLSNTNTSALAIYNKGVVTNASGAATGSSGIEVADTGPTFFIYNGGSYRHATSCRNAPIVENLSGATGTEQGVFDFRLPATAPASNTISVAGRTYGILIFRNRPGRATTSYPGAGSSLTIQGNLLIGPGATFTATINNDLRIAGDVRVQGAFQVKATSPASPTSQLVLAGTKPQTISGSVSLDTGIGLAINNAAGVVLATPLQLSGALTLTSGSLTTSMANLLTLTNTAAISGGSKINFVNGPLARQTVAGALSNLVFPIGSGPNYQPIVLDASAQDATTYVVMPKEGVAATTATFLAGNSALPTLTRVSQVRSYTITPTPTTNNFSGTVTIPYGFDDNVNQPNDAGFTIGKNSNGAGWQNIGSSAVTITTAATSTTPAVGTITSQVFTSFSDFALASTSADPQNNPLPVTLTSFGAVRQASGAVQVRWATASEQRSAYFEVQRSIDGRAFATIERVAASGTTPQAHKYAHLDSQAPTGALSYRLRQVDTDGTAVFSPVVTLAATAAATLSLYPNPAHNYLTIASAAGQAVHVLDLAGRVVQTSTLPASGELRLDALPAGTYLLRMSLDGLRQTLRFTKE